MMKNGLPNGSGKIIHNNGSRWEGDFVNGKEEGIIYVTFADGTNAVAESFFSSLKTERILFAKYKSRDAAKKDITDYIEMFYISRRRHSYLGNVSPKQYEDTYQRKVA
jgi:hypothetical protein